jgi:hypothetical protein
VKGALKAVMPQSVRRSLLRTVNQRLLHRSPKPLDAELMAQLRTRFKPEVIALSEYLGEDFVARWGYEHVE